MMKIHFVASKKPDSLAVLQSFIGKYGQVDVEEAEVIVSLSGDGMVLHTMHTNFERSVPIYGMNRGKVGFLTNSFHADGLIARLEKAQKLRIHPLMVEAINTAGQAFESMAINEVCLMRDSNQAARIRVAIDDIVRLNEIVCDGIIVSSPIGSTAYNLSVGGPVLPLDCGLLSLTAISPFRPRMWRGALIKDTSTVSAGVLDPYDRSVKVVADYVEFKDVKDVRIKHDKSKYVTLLLDDVQAFQERVLAEPFATD